MKAARKPSYTWGNPPAAVRSTERADGMRRRRRLEATLTANPELARNCDTVLSGVFHVSLLTVARARKRLVDAGSIEARSTIKGPSTRRRKIEADLAADPTLAHRSDYMLAAAYGVCYQTVRRARRRLEDRGVIPVEKARICADGSERTFTRIGWRCEVPRN
jgi:DNA-binding transcriptional regulator YhcF (GntR family)